MGEGIVTKQKLLRKWREAIRDGNRYKAQTIEKVMREKGHLK